MTSRDMNVCVYVLVVTGMLEQAPSEAWIQQFSFQQMDPGSATPHWTAGWTAPSLVTCALSCEAMDTPCYYFVYDEDTSACTPVVSLGARLAGGDDATSALPLRGSLLSMFSCTQAGYTLHTSHDTVLCLRQSSNQLNYTNAELACQAEGSHLVTFRTLEKMQLLKQVMKGVDNSIWVGLDDRQAEDTFRWIDNGETISPDFIRSIFPIGQPDNLLDREDCTVYDKVFPFNDRECYAEFGYLCEHWLP